MSFEQTHIALFNVHCNTSAPAGICSRLQACRDDVVWSQVLWSREQRKEEGRNAPGPGFYKAESASRALSRQAAAYSFSAAHTGREVTNMCLSERMAAPSLPLHQSLGLMLEACLLERRLCHASDMLASQLSWKSVLSQFDQSPLWQFTSQVKVS